MPIVFELPSAVSLINERLSTLVQAALEQIDRKISAPLDVLPVNNPLSKAIKDWDETIIELATSNNQLSSVNNTIHAIKEANSLKDRAAIQSELNTFFAVKSRHIDPVLTLANKYNALNTQKDAITIQKDNTKKALNNYDSTVIVKHQESINKYLELFGTGFRLVKTTKNYVGKLPQVVYHLEIETGSPIKQAVDISAKEVAGKQSFRTIMSAGDKSTLALAFFLAQIDLDSVISQKVVVFDDPFTSLDDFRREMTAKSIFRVGQSASQVLVFSHDKYFLDSEPIAKLLP